MAGPTPNVSAATGLHPAPVLLGFVLGPRLEENFRRALTLSRGDVTTFIGSPISAALVALAVLLVVAQIWLAWRQRGKVVNNEPSLVLEEP